MRRYAASGDAGKGLISALLWTSLPTYFSKQLDYCGQILEILDFGSQKRRRSGERREGWKEKRESSLGGQTRPSKDGQCVWNVSLFQLKGGGVEVSQNEWHRKLCHGQKEWAKQWDSHHQIKVH